MDEKLQVIKPYGHLYANGQYYYLLRPEPVCGDSWEGDNCYRFLATPLAPIEYVEKGKDNYAVYGYARHVVTNAFTIEYMTDIEEIHVQLLDDIDLTKLEIHVEEEENAEENYPF